MEHLIIPDAQRHEAKGASTAALNTVLKSNGNGTTNFGLVAYSELSGRPSFAGYQRVLSASSVAVTQNPTALNTVLQVEFGTGVVTANVTLATNGLLTFNIAGDYQVTTTLNFSRTAGAGQVIMFSRILVNGTTASNTNAIVLDNAVTTVPISNTYNITATSGMTLQLQVYRDGAGINNGGLSQLTPTLAGWTNFPSATVLIDKYVGAV